MRRFAVCIIVGATFSSAAEASDCPTNPSFDQIAASLGREQAFGEVGQFLVEDSGNLKPVFYTKNNGRAVYEGDIILGRLDELETLSKGGPISVSSADGMQPFGLMYRRVLTGAAKWSNATIPYVIDPSAPNIEKIKSAMKKWQDDTGLKFVQRTRDNEAAYKNYVKFKQGVDPNACYSETLGMKGGEQYVELVSGCEFGQILHEIGHVLGLDHEQNRADRSNFVTINFQNIWPQYASAFMQDPGREADVGKYDFDSIMHYEPRAFSCNNKVTIVSKSGASFGQRDHLSAGDIALIKKAYALP